MRKTNLILSLMLLICMAGPAWSASRLLLHDTGNYHIGDDCDPLFTPECPDDVLYSNSFEIPAGMAIPINAYIIIEMELFHVDFADVVEINGTAIASLPSHGYETCTDTCTWETGVIYFPAAGLLVEGTNTINITPRFHLFLNGMDDVGIRNLKITGVSN